MLLVQSNEPFELVPYQTEGGFPRPDKPQNYIEVPYEPSELRVNQLISIPDQ